MSGGGGRVPGGVGLLHMVLKCLAEVLQSSAEVESGVAMEVAPGDAG